MKNKSTLLFKSIFCFSLLLLLMNCRKEELTEEQNPPVNSFEMVLNEKTWRPSQIGEDECMQAFYGAWSSVTESGVENPFFSILAYQDPEEQTTPRSENVLEIQVSNLQKLGTYYLTGSREQSFSSFAVFTANKPDGTYNRYLNKENPSSFVVEVEEFLPKPGSSVTGIKGTFYGTLFNETNPLDSISINQGNFTFNVVNWYNFNQCTP